MFLFFLSKHSFLCRFFFDSLSLSSSPRSTPPNGATSDGQERGRPASCGCDGLCGARRRRGGSRCGHESLQLWRREQQQRRIRARARRAGAAGRRRLCRLWSGTPRSRRHQVKMKLERDGRERERERKRWGIDIGPRPTASANETRALLFFIQKPRPSLCFPPALYSNKTGACLR